MDEDVIFPAMPVLKTKGVVNGSRRWALVQNLYYHGGVVSHGFITDGASVPRLLWPLFPPYGQLFPAAIVHDWNYYRQSLTRKKADNQLLQNMRHCGVSWITSRLIYQALRIFGGIAWRRNKRRHASSFWDNGKRII